MIRLENSTDAFILTANELVKDIIALLSYLPRCVFLWAS